MDSFSCCSVNLGGWLVSEPVSQTGDFQQERRLSFFPFYLVHVSLF